MAPHGVGASEPDSRTTTADQREGLFDAPAEKVAENTLGLVATVLDWSLADLNLQVGRADVVLSASGIKRLVLEVKRPGSLIWRRGASKRRWIKRAVTQRVSGSAQSQ
jgi:hypothetical protein